MRISGETELPRARANGISKSNILRTQARKSLRLCLAGLRIGRLDLIAEASELPDHFGSALLLRLFGDRWAAFLATDSFVQD